MTVGFAVIISYTVALSFIPSLSARVLKKDESKFYTMTEPLFKMMERVYEGILKAVLRFKIITLIGVFLLFFFSLSLFPKIGMDFIPKEDKAEFEVHIKADASVSLEEMIRKSKDVEALVKKNKDVLYTTVSVGYNAAQEKHKSVIYVKLTDRTTRSINQEQIIQNLRGELLPLQKDLFITAAAIPNIKGAGVSVPYQIVLKSDSFEALKVGAKNLTDYLAKKKGFVDIDTNLDDGKPQIDININRNNANRLGISASQIAGTIATAFSSDLNSHTLKRRVSSTTLR